MSAADASTLRCSVVLPVLNGAAHLVEALEAIDAQTTPVHDLVVVDGGSTDATVAVATAWLALRVDRGARVTVLKRPGSGVAEAHNAGIAATDGELILFAAHDDTLDQDAVAHHVTALTGQPEAGMSVGLVEFFGDGTDATRTDTPPVDATDRSAADGSVGGPVRTGLVGTVRRVRVLEAVVVRRTVVEQLGGFRTDLGPSTDLEWIARLADADVVTAEVPHVVVRKRLHPESVTYRRPETRSEVVGALRATILRRRSQT